MAFQTITIGSSTFNSVGAGKYSLSTVLFGQPANGINLSPGKKQGKTGPTTASVSRVLEKDVTVGDTVERRRMVITMQMSVPDGFLAGEVNAAAVDISTFLGIGSVTRLLLGES